MKNKIIKELVKIICVCTLLFSLTGCAPSEKLVTVNVDTNNLSVTSNTVLGKEALIKIGDYLWYDQTTRIVYWWGGYLTTTGRHSTTPTPYYASNGLPYRYNPETNTFEEVEK